MKAFADLFLKLERCKDNNEKSCVIAEFFAGGRGSEDADAAWVVYLLLNRWTSGSKIAVDALRGIAQQVGGIPDWLFDECLATVDDVCETIALLVPPAEATSEEGVAHWVGVISKILSASGSEQEAMIRDAWQRQDNSQRLVFNKLLTGTLKIKVESGVVARALASVYELEVYKVTARVGHMCRRAASGPEAFAVSEGIREWEPTAEAFKRIIVADGADVANCEPYAFMSSVEVNGSEDVVDPSVHLIEWKWRGIRAQLVKREGVVSLWSKDQDLLNERFPELIEEATQLDDGIVLDGEILGFKDSDILPRQALLQRMNRRMPSKQVMDDTPVVFMAYDILEENGVDLRRRSIEDRKERLAYVLSTRKKVASESEFQQLTLFAPCQVQLSTKLRNSPILQAKDHSELEALFAQSRLMRVGGLLLKRKGSSYKNSDDAQWQSWNLGTIKVDAVLIAAQPAGGKRTGVFTDYTLAVWQNSELLPVARVSSPFEEEETLFVDKFIRENTLAKFGPVASVKPELVFEISCDEVNSSGRHKAGLTLSRPRILRLRSDLRASQAASLSSIKSLCV